MQHNRLACAQDQAVPSLEMGQKSKSTLAQGTKFLGRVMGSSVLPEVLADAVDAARSASCSLCSLTLDVQPLACSSHAAVTRLQAELLGRQQNRQSAQECFVCCPRELMLNDAFEQNELLTQLLYL